ncbi:hypothetical protein [Kosmotoga sp. DU53]|nr:hypothetical protein [Kosmotoga sp. DU53]
MNVKVLLRIIAVFVSITPDFMELSSMRLGLFHCGNWKYAKKTDIGK